MNDDEMHPDEIAFNQRINAVFLRKQKMSFDEVVRQYRQIEVEFVERAGINDHHVVETKRRITEWLLSEAERSKQPHDVCRGIWEELVLRGFSDHLQKSTFTGIYVRCCQINGEIEAGLALLQPLITELEQWLQESTLAPELRTFWERTVAVDRKLRDELKAGVRE